MSDAASSSVRSSLTPRPAFVRPARTNRLAPPINLDPRSAEGRRWRYGARRSS